MRKRKFEEYCIEDPSLIENYEKAKAVNFRGWCIHHKLQTHNSDGERRFVNIEAVELIALGMYYSRPASELIFLTVSEHSALHMKGHKGYSYKHTDEARQRIAEAKLGDKNPTKKSAAAYKEYKANGGTLTWNQFQKEFKK